MIYTFTGQRFNKILFRGYDDSGKRIHLAEAEHTPELYIESKTPTQYKSVYHTPESPKFLTPKRFDTIKFAREFVKNYSAMIPIYGNTAYEYDYIHRNFKGELNVDIGQLSVHSIDIETETELGGFPDVEKADERIQLITVMNFNTKKMVTYGLHPSVEEDYVLCRDEQDLLIRFIQYIVKQDPDIIVGWNLVYFDIAYLCSRIAKLLGDKVLSKLSPFGFVDKKTDSINGKELLRYEIVGRVQLDLLDLYKKFRFITRPSYKLGYIGEVEIGETKLENPHSTFRDFYIKDWELFVRYNKIDVLLVDKLESKLGLVFLAIALAYRTKANFDDVYSPIKLWENYIKHSLYEEDVFATVVKPKGNGSSIEGGYVKEPKPGIYSWPMAFDATALYPSIIMSLGISPELLVGMMPGISPDGLIAGMKFDLKETQSLAANGAMFDKTREGTIPILVKKVFNKRKEAKKRMLNAKSENEKILEELKRRGVLLHE